MTSAKFHNSGRNQWGAGPSKSDPERRRLIYGRIKPMHEPGILQRLFGGT